MALHTPQNPSDLVTALPCERVFLWTPSCPRRCVGLTGAARGRVT